MPITQPPTQTIFKSKEKTKDKEIKQVPKTLPESKLSETVIQKTLGDKPEA